MTRLILENKFVVINIKLLGRWAKLKDAASDRAFRCFSHNQHNNTKLNITMKMTYSHLVTRNLVLPLLCNRINISLNFWNVSLYYVM